MIITTIEINELPNGVLTVEVTPTIKDPSEKESFAYHLMVHSLNRSLERLMIELGGRGESIMGNNKTPQSVFDAARARAHNLKHPDQE